MKTTNKTLVTIKTETEILFIKKGISEKQIEELVYFANHDLQVAKFTGDKARFADRKKASFWLKTGDKTVYILADKDENLLGIIWFHPMDNPKASGYGHTFAIRLYGRVRGRGLAQKFMEICFKDYGKKDIWLSVSHDNTAAVRAYEKFGFKKVSGPDAKGKMIMVYI